MVATSKQVDPSVPLTNARHERMAQAMADGMTAHDAHIEAGYTANRGNASAIARLKHVQSRVEFLLKQRNAVKSERAELTRDWVLDQLRHNADRALQATPVLDARGNPTGEYRWDGGVANRALELLGKELGMFAERRHVESKITVTDEQQSEADRTLAEARAKLAALRTQH